MARGFVIILMLIGHANVMGTDGIEYMIQSSQNLPVDVHFMLPSCVPATAFDESGAELGYKDIDSYFEHKKVLGLAEMMNYVGVINGDDDVVSKIVASQAHHKQEKESSPYAAACHIIKHSCHSVK